jgi:hypothetical protein
MAKLDNTLRGQPIHERIRPLGWVRGKIRAAFFRFVHSAAQTDDARAIIVEALGNVIARRPVAFGKLAAESPYSGLGQAGTERPTAERDDVILITARFRSGSTLLWNLFRNIPGHTSYYEPFNERRWFDPAVRGSRVDPTHQHAEEYWREYEGLQVLGDYYQESWIDRDLFMDGDCWNPAMKRYVEILIENAAGRPVLQFNRIDFRLQWLRRYFPHARILHLYRHPRDQWMSSLVDPGAFPKDAPATAFPAHDHYYLYSWARDLKYQFPFLADPAAHPYATFYYLWKLSYLFGRAYADHSVSFEELAANPDKQLSELFRQFEVSGVDLEKLKSLIVAPRLNKWREYAPDSWFAEHEGACERVLREFLPG